MRRRAPLRPLDAAVILALAALTAYASVRLYAPKEGPARLVVESEAGRFIYPLDKDHEIVIKGPLGETHVHVEGGAAHIHDSPCPNKTCLSAPPVARPGDWSACLPNKVLIRVEGTVKESEIDVLSR